MTTPLHLFEGYGIEIEYAIVDTDLHVRPLAAALLREATGLDACEVERGPIAWSNELTLHVIELKTNGPVPALTDAVADAFVADLHEASRLLAPMGARLVPAGMHPTMDPTTDAQLWPYEGEAVYAAYDRIFGCAGHGWSNLQSCHLNLPFCGDDELGRLHLAVRAILPLVPALAASSPVMDARITGALDNRLVVYRENQSKLASIMGRVIPEPVTTRAAYEAEILAPMYADIAPLDPGGDLQHEWLNSRGAIARFDRSAIEIRLLDVQETPLVDLAIAWLVAETTRALVDERWVGRTALAELSTDALVSILDRTIVQGERARVDHDPLLRALGWPTDHADAAQVWAHLAGAVLPARAPACTRMRSALDVVLEHGPLARRLLRALGSSPSRTRIHAVYERLTSCLLRAEPFMP